MSNGRFQIFLRKMQIVYSNPDTGVTYNVIVQCDPLTGWSQYVPGNVDNTFYDFTDYIEDSEKLSFSWDRVSNGNSSNSDTSMDGSNFSKGITSDLIFFDKAYQFIYDWLLSTECQILNCVEVKIVDLIAHGTYRIFEIKNDNIEWSPVDEPCRFHIKLREQDVTWHCIFKTFIWDNFQHWFEDSNVKQHPCFLTAIEPRPRIISSARLGFLLFWHSVLLLPAAGLVSVILDLLIGQNFIREARKILEVDKFVDAPLIRTYIENVAGKCGLTTDTIFDQGQHWENLCLYYPQSGYMWESDGDGIYSPSMAYHFDNRWLITIADLFDKLKLVFAAEWFISANNTLVFKHTKDLIDIAAIYDFSLPNSEPIYGLTYTFNGDKKPAYGSYEYQTDGSDLASQEMSTLYNDIVDFDGPNFNPMLSGNVTKNFEFAPTGFVRDGRSKDYLTLLVNDAKTVALLLTAIIAVVIIAEIGGALTIITAGVTIALVLAVMIIASSLANTLRNEFVNSETYTGAVRLTSEQVLTPRLLLWDGARMDRAKTIRQTSMPAPNTFYNPTSVAYNIKNSINVNGDNPDHAIYNYPLYFDGDFKGNLFDSYHDEIDNPLKSKESHQQVKFYVDLCETMLNLFGVFESQYAVIGKVVLVEKRDNYNVYARIGNIQIDYDSNQIIIKGVVLRKAV